MAPHVPSRNLCSQHTSLSVNPRAKKKFAGSRMFSLWAPELWNALPTDIGVTTSVEMLFYIPVRLHSVDGLFDCLLYSLPWFGTGVR